MPHIVSLPIVLFLSGLACSSKPDGTSDSGPGPTTGGDTGASTDTGPTTACAGSASGTLTKGLTELAWDDGVAIGSIIGQGWTVVDTDLSAQPLHEWVRFEPDAPISVHGISVQLDNLPEDPDTPVTLGLYSDFGYNGFDAWGDEALWTGTRCAGDLVEGDWQTWVVDPPIEIPAGSLVYAGHLRQGADDVAISFDSASAGDGTCTSWDDCHSAMNLPDLTRFTWDGVSYSFWKGYSFSLQYDYLVRLQVQIDDSQIVKDKRFHQVTEAPSGSRQAWGDYDFDGWDDLYLPGALYHNQGGGVFLDVTDAAGVGGVSSSGGVWGDYDNDGCLDLFVFVESTSQGDTLFHSNCDGTFSDVTASAGLDDSLDGSDACGATHRSTAAAAWLDLDGDGLLDLYSANFICWDAYSYYVDQVWHNQGDGSFTALGYEQGFSTTAWASRGAAPIDANLDGDVDLLVTNYVLQRNLFYDNQGDGTVSDRGTSLGLSGDGTFALGATYYGHTIGAAWGDLDNDGDFDLIQANLAHPRYFDFSNKTQVLMNVGGNGEDATWEDNAGDWADPFPDNGLRYQETHSVPILGDFDSDGMLDLAISAVYDGRPTDFYWGNGDGTFTPGWYEAGITTESGWGMSAGDYDNDGDLDLSTSDGFFENRGAQGHWLQVRPVGVTSNTSAIGAVVHVTTDDGVVRMRQVQGGTGQGEQNSATLHFGLGNATQVSTVQVDYIGGETVTWTGPWEPDQRLWAYEDGTLATGFAPPSR
ncbi:MAG: CRTAC1 family protein [Oligoflexia bacterium]|nr:CRTAC1 family protein [Oligoflexia bacterium]